MNGRFIHQKFEPKLDPHDLASKLKAMVRNERKILTQILEHLQQFNKSSGYLDLGYPTLFEFCVSHLGYSEAAAYRRIQAMRLLNEIPEIKPKIESGILNIAHLAQAQNFFNLESKKNHKYYSKHEKHQILNKIENKSKLETQKELTSLSPNLELNPSETVRFVDGRKVQLKTLLDQKTFGKLQNLKQIYSHKNPKMTFAELIDILADLGLKNKVANFSREIIKPKQADLQETELLKIRMGVPRNRYISQEIRRLVWQRDCGKCTFVDAVTGRRCNSQHLLQIDHIQPFSHAGLSTDAKNLRLLCANHNRHSYKFCVG